MCGSTSKHTYKNVNCCALVSLKLGNSWTDLANFDVEILREFIEGLNRYKLMKKCDEKDKNKRKRVRIVFTE